MHRIPHGLPLLNAVLAEPVAVVLKALRHSGEVRGTRAVVIGAGPIGHIAALTLRELGADVLAVDADPHRLDLLRHADISTSEELTEETVGDASTVIEAAGASDLVTRVTELAPPATRVVVLGRPGEDGGPPNAPTADRRDIEVVSSLGSDPQDWPVAIEMLASGRPNLGWLTERVDALENYEQGWRRVRERDGLKTILRVDASLAGE